MFEIERFSFDCRKVIGFAFTTLRDWLKRLAPLFHPVGSKTKTNRPFYSCVLSYLAMNASEAGGDLALIQTFQLFSCKCKLVSICSIRTTRFAQQK